MSENVADADELIAQISGMLRELASEILRVTAGAGSAGSIPGLIAGTLDAMIDYREALGHGPSAAMITEALDPNIDRSNDYGAESYFRSRMREISGSSSDAYETAWAEAKKEVQRGALRAVASALVSQATQRAHGESLMFKGIRDLTDLRLKNRSRAG